MKYALKKSWLFLATHHMVTKTDIVRRFGGIIYKCQVRGEVCQVRGCMAVCRCVKDPCQYDGSTLPRWRTRCHGDMVAAWWWQVECGMVGRCSRWDGETVWQVPRRECVATGTVEQYGRWQDGMVSWWHGCLVTWRHKGTIRLWNGGTVKWLWPSAWSYGNMVTIYVLFLCSYSFNNNYSNLIININLNYYYFLFPTI